MNHCTRCGSPAGPAQSFCAGCGTALTAATSARSSAPVITALVAGAVVLVAALVAGAVVLVQGGDEPTPVVDATSSTANAPATAPSSSDPTPEPTADAEGTETADAGASSPQAAGSTGPGDVMDLPSGLFCRDLMSRGFSYVASIDYWRGHGQPNQMDADRNGIPCETVYSSTDVSAYWGTTGTPDLVPTLTGDVLSLPSGLLCRDLRARGFGYSDAVDYWLVTGSPDAMDADLNGIPCETVYSVSDVDDYWTY